MRLRRNKNAGSLPNRGSLAHNKVLLSAGVCTCNQLICRWSFIGLIHGCMARVELLSRGYLKIGVDKSSPIYHSPLRSKIQLMLLQCDYKTSVLIWSCWLATRYSIQYHFNPKNFSLNHCPTSSGVLCWSYNSMPRSFSQATSSVYFQRASWQDIILWLWGFSGISSIRNWSRWLCDCATYT